MEWIKCSDKLPKPYTRVLIFKGERHKHLRRILFGHVTVAGNWFDQHGKDCEVTHWSPLPNPPIDIDKFLW